MRQSGAILPEVTQRRGLPSHYCCTTVIMNSCSSWWNSRAVGVMTGQLWPVGRLFSVSMSIVCVSPLGSRKLQEQLNKNKATCASFGFTSYVVCTTTKLIIYEILFNKLLTYALIFTLNNVCVIAHQLDTSTRLNFIDFYVLFSHNI